MGLPIEKISSLKGKDLQNELTQLRGAYAFTTHRGKVPEKIKNKESVDNDDRNKKIIIALALVGAAAYVYINMG